MKRCNISPYRSNKIAPTLLHVKRDTQNKVSLHICKKSILHINPPIARSDNTWCHQYVLSYLLVWGYLLYKHNCEHFGYTSYSPSMKPSDIRPVHTCFALC